MTEQTKESKRGPGRPGEDRKFWLGVRIKVPLGKWLKTTAKKRSTTMGRIVEEILQTEMDRQAVPKPRKGPNES
jgi:hypothetical protein